LGIDDCLDSLPGGVAGMVVFAADEFAVDFFLEKFALLLGLMLGGSSSSMMMGMGLLLVHRWFTCLVALITLGAVGSFDVGAEIGLGAVMPFTLGGCNASTLGGVDSVMMDCRALIWPAWVSLFAASGGVFCFINCKNCCAARRVRSASESEGTLQFVR
jgi:hypothetical protein